MKKMLAKAVALSLVLGGVGFVANDAHVMHMLLISVLVLEFTPQTLALVKDMM